MAGSYRHATTDSGNLRAPESFTQMVENLGDAYDTVEEMYGMIWWLASKLTNHPDDPAEMRAQVEEARRMYESGLAEAREANRGA